MRDRPDYEGFDELSTEEKIRLVQELWDRIPVDSAFPLPTDAQQAEIDRRIRTYDEDPTRTIPWAELRDRLRRRAR